MRSMAPSQSPVLNRRNQKLPMLSFYLQGINIIENFPSSQDVCFWKNQLSFVTTKCGAAKPPLQCKGGEKKNTYAHRIMLSKTIHEKYGSVTIACFESPESEIANAFLLSPRNQHHWELPIVTRCMLLKNSVIICHDKMWSVDFAWLAPPASALQVFNSEK